MRPFHDRRGQQIDYGARVRFPKPSNWSESLEGSVVGFDSALARHRIRVRYHNAKGRLIEAWRHLAYVEVVQPVEA